jgi:hypothetical protein
MFIILNLSAIFFLIYLHNHERIHPAEEVLSISKLLSLYYSHLQLALRLGLGLGLGLRSNDGILSILSILSILLVSLTII